MPKVVDKPEKLKPYLFLGLNLNYGPNDKEAVGQCPFCGREDKFSVNIETGQYRCFVCHTGGVKGGGNATVFVREFHAQVCDEQGLDELAKEWGLLSADSLRAWRVKRNPLNNWTIIPGDTAEQKIGTLYQYIYNEREGRFLMYPTPTLGHHIHGGHLYDPKKPHVHVAEGPKDGIAWWEALQLTKRVNGTLSPTGSPSGSIATEINVLAVPGCGSVGDPMKKWMPYFSGKEVTWLEDSDWPRAFCAPCKQSWFLTDNPEPAKCPTCNKEGKRSEPAGYVAAKRAAELFLTAEQPITMHHLEWGPEGFAPVFKSGYDIRDFLSGGTSIRGRVDAVKSILNLVKPIPSDWIPGRSANNIGDGSVALDILTCTSWKDLIGYWDRPKVMKWTSGLNRSMAAILATIASTNQRGDDQLWLRLIGPPSSGKTTLLEGACTNRTYLFPKDTMTGLYSGYQTDQSGSENLSMALSLNGKTLAIKDGDTILQNPAAAVILSQFRGFYDRALRTQFKNKMSMDYEGYSTTVIINATAAIRSLNSSELGDRFIDCVLMESIDDELEDEIGLMKAKQTFANMGMEVGTTTTSHSSLEKNDALRRTGGYVDYLRKGATELFSQLSSSDGYIRRISRLGKFVACMRARPSTKQRETVEREFSPRLVSQFTRLAASLAVVLNRNSIDDEVYDLTRTMALHTSVGVTLNITRDLMDHDDRGTEMQGLATRLGYGLETTRHLLKFLGHIRVCEWYRQATSGQSGGVIKWRLTSKMRDLYREVMIDA